MATQRSNCIDVQDGRQLPFCQVENALIRSSELDPYAKLVYVALCGYANVNSLDCFPGIDTLASDLGISKPTLRKAIKQLTEHGVLEVAKRKDALGRDMSHRYIIKDWRSKPDARVNDVDPRVNDVDPRVKDIDGEGKGRLRGRVKDVYPKDIERERDRSKDTIVASASDNVESPKPTAKAKTSKPEKSNKPKADPDEIYAYVTGIAEAAGYDPDTYKKHPWAFSQCLQAIDKHYTLEELQGCVAYMLETNGNWWARRTIKPAQVTDEIDAYHKAVKNGWHPGQKGSSNGRTNTHQGASNNVATDEDIERYKQRERERELANTS